MSNRIATGVLSNCSPINYRRQTESHYPAEARCIVRRYDPSELEKQLSAQFGDKLQPIQKDPKYPGVFGMEDIKAVKQAAAKAPKREQAKMLPKHLTASRLVELSRQGKTLSDIAKLYNSDIQTVEAKATEWGIEGLLNG